MGTVVILDKTCVLAAFTVPDGESEIEAAERIRAIAGKVIAGEPDWTYDEDIEPALAAAGYEACGVEAIQECDLSLD